MTSSIMLQMNNYNWNTNQLFDLKWWRIHLTDARHSKYKKLGFVAVTIVGFTPTEYREITKWSKENHIAHVSKQRKWEDDIEFASLSKVLNYTLDLAEELGDNYTEREMNAYDTEDNIKKLEEFLSSMPRRTETFVSDITLLEIEKMCKSSNTRLIYNRSIDDPDVFIVSTANKEIFMHLLLSE